MHSKVVTYIAILRTISSGIKPAPHVNERRSHIDTSIPSSCTIFQGKEDLVTEGIKQSVP
jgi:hypothetical protein